MTPRRFPRSPASSPRPFESGENPFRDDVTTPIPFSDHPLSPPATDEVQPFKAAEYEQTLPDRSSRILWQGVIGASLVGASLVIVLVVVASRSLFAPELIYSLPIGLMGLGLCIPAWVMARSDLRAIGAGVMNDSGLREIRIAYWCGGLGTLCGLIPFLGSVTAIVLSIIG